MGGEAKLWCGLTGAGAVLIAVVALAGCVATGEIECADGIVCSAAQVCAPAGGACVDPAQVLACDGRAEGDACTLGGIGDGTCRTGLCVITGCGDGVVDVGEACDDGNTVDDDGCTNACARPACGDGVRQGSETCDDGAANGDDRACTSACATAACGDGLVRAGVEACDLGAGNADGGACTTACAAATCGDGLTWLGVEGCDDGNAVDDDACRDACVLPTCGDGVVQSGEACDDGAGNGDDRACTIACQAATCGDGKILLGVEGCDAAAANADDAACTLACQVNACGDGAAWAGVEACDDGNDASGDGCRGDCRKVEACGDGAVDTGEVCDDGAAGLPNPADGCDACVATAWTASAVLGLERLGTDVGLAGPRGVAVDRAGNLYVADMANNRIRRVAADTGVITTVVGTGAYGYAGDGGAATSAALAMPHAVAVDGAGNLYLSDLENARIRRVAAGPGVITTVAGNGLTGFAGDDGAATSAALNRPWGVTVDGAGNLYLADSRNHRIRRVAAGTGVITTVAGTGDPGSAGDGGAATSAQLAFPYGVVADGAGNLYIADAGNRRIRRVAAGTGVITTVAGTGDPGSAGDGGAATSAQLVSAWSVAVDGAGSLYIADAGGHRIRRVAATTGIITTVAGTGADGFAGDGGAATAAQLHYPAGVALDGAGNLYVADASNQRIRRVAAATGVITTVAGTGFVGSTGDGGAATSAQLARPYGTAVDGAGNLYVADRDHHRIRRVTAATGAITTIAGAGVPGFAGDDGAATSARLDNPYGVALDGADNLYIADRDNHRIRRVALATGIITTVAGTGDDGFAGDDGAATSAQLSRPRAVAVDGAGDLYVADSGNNRVRRVTMSTGVITTVAGTGVEGVAGDGDAATNAELALPRGIAVDGTGNLYIADRDSRRIRRVAADTGIITTVAGTGDDGFAGDGGAATSAQLSRPRGVAVDAAGNLYIADRESRHIRRVAVETGIITTIAGGGLAGLDGDGDGGAATSGRLNAPVGVTVDAAGNVYLADPPIARVRRVAAGTGVITTVAGVIAPEGLGPAAQASVADPRGLALAPGLTVFAGGVTGTVQALRLAAQQLEVVVGRYPQQQATADVARFRNTRFGTVGGVAYDAALGRLYLTETTAHRLHVVTITDIDDEDTWTIATLAGDAAGIGTAAFADGPALAARFDSPTGLFFDEATRILYVADAGNHVVRSMPIDLAGAAGDVTTLAGTPRTLGFFGDGRAATDALLYGPQAITRCGNGDLFIADTTNQRVRRIEAGTGVITTVLGDGVAASSGQGAPAVTFPVDTPLGLACDAFGNLLVTSRTTVRLVVADATGVVDGGGAVQTIYGAAPRTAYPASVTTCLTGVAVVDAETVQATDACAGVLVELWRQPVAP